MHFHGQRDTHLDEFKTNERQYFMIY